jgi:hypothetical protein
LISDDLQTSITQILREIVAAIENAPELSQPGDHALLRSYLDQDGVVPDPDGAAGEALAAAVGRLTGGRPGLFGGITGIGWTVAHLAGGETADRVCEAIDRALARQLAAERHDDYDLISGLVGLGVYALERGDAGHSIATKVLDHLERAAQPRAGGLAWHTVPELLPPWQREVAPEGYWNLGLAHGIPGVIALLARYVVNDIDPQRSRQLLAGAMTWMLAAEPASSAGRYPSWHAGPNRDDAPAVSDSPASGRLAWCYGDLGIALALLAAAQATGDPHWRAEALAIGSDCAARSIEAGRVRDAGICHGALGVAHLFNRLRAATGEPQFARAARTWLEHGLAMRTEQPLAGFPSFELTENMATWRADASLLTGVAGVGLVLQSMISEHEPAWDRLLLTDVAC